MRILYLSDDYSKNVLGVKASMFRELSDRGMDVSWESVHQAGNGIVDGPKLLTRIAKDHYDWIWFAHSWTRIHNATKKQFADLGTYLFGFGLSDPRNFHPSRADEYHCYATNDLQTFKDLDSDDTAWSPPSCDLTYHRKYKVDEDIDILFYGLGVHPVLGSYRPEVVQRLRSRLPGVNVQVAGHNWPMSMKPLPHMTGEPFINLINRAKVGIDITKPGAPLGRRNFEMPACGTMIIPRRSEQTSLLFGECLTPMWSTEKELANICMSLLEDDGRRRRDADVQYQFIRENHSVVNRISDLLLCCSRWISRNAGMTPN